METLEIERMGAGEEPSALRSSAVQKGMPRDRERENAEDLAIFRDFLGGLAVGPAGARTSREAFTKIYLRYRERVYGYALRVLANEEDAEDLFQEVFYRVYTRAQTFEQEKSLGGWIFTIAHNLCMNKVRDRKPQETIEDLTLSVEPNDDFGEDWKTVIAQAMAQLPLEYREALVLREYEGLSYAEITEVLQTSVPAVKSRIYRAKERLRDLLAPYYQDRNA